MPGEGQLKHVTQTPSSPAPKGSLSVLNAKSAALRGGSVFAICHSLMFRAFPAVVVCGGVTALADDRLVAVEGQGGAPHVRVMLVEPAPAAERPLRLAAAGPRSLSGVQAEHGLPIAGFNPDERALPVWERTQSAIIAHAAFVHTGIAGFDLPATLQQADEALDRAGTAVAAFFLATQGAAAQVSSGSWQVAAKSGLDRVGSSFIEPHELTAALAPIGQHEHSQERGRLHAPNSSPRIDYLPFSMEVEASEGSATTLSETTATGVLLTRSEPPLAITPFIPFQPVLYTGNGSHGGAGRRAPSMPADDFAINSVMPRPEDLEARSAQSPAYDDMPLSFANLLAGSGRESGAGLLPAHLFVSAGPDVSAERQLPAVDQVKSDDSHQGHFKRPVTSAPEDFRAGVASVHSGPLGFGASLNGAAAQTEAYYPDDLDRVQLKALVEMFRDRFEASEWDRNSRSHALEAYVPVSKLNAAGIPLSVDRVTDQLTLDLTAAQFSPSPAGSGAPAGNGSSGFFGMKQSLAATASAGYDSDPFLAPGGQGAAAASVRLQVAPSISRQGERNSFRLSGRLEHIEYLGSYDSLQNYGADFAATHKASERLEFDLGLLFNSDNLATNLSNPFFNSDLSPGTPVPPVGNDITILGQQQRRTSYGANGGLTYILSERDELRWALNARAERFGSNGLTDSDFVSQQLRYSRQVGEGFTVGAMVDAGLINFSDSALGNAKSVSPQLVASAPLSPLLKLSGSVGVAITRTEFGALKETSTALAGNLSLCRQGERSNLCINGSRQVLPSAIGGARVQTIGGLSYSFRLSERDSLRLNGSYSTASEPLAVAGGNLESINGSVRFERQINERLQFFASGGYLNASGNSQGNASNYQALVGITFNLGNTR